MTNDYLKFNAWSYQYYLDRNSIYDIGTFAIEVTEIENYCKENDLTDLNFREIVELDWSNLLHFGNNEIPKYFGLIALQCYAASIMQSDHNVGVNDYQTRFLEITGITDQQDLQQKFKSKYFGIPIQEKIWIEAKETLSKLNIEIQIPDQSNGAGRYVQYPKKQVVLNQEDLKEYFDLFKNIEEEFEVVSFNEFKKYFKNNITKHQFIRNNNSKNNRSENENNIKLKQIFDYYCSENWRDLKKSISNNNNKTFIEKYILLYSEFAEKKIKLYKDESTEIYFSKGLFSKNPLKGIVFFKKSQEYENEYDYVNYLEEGKEYIFVTNNTFNSHTLKIIKYHFELIDINLTDNLLFKGIIDKNELPLEFIELIKESYPIELVGVKISQKKQYLHSFPPIINNIKNLNYRVLPDYNIKDVKVGKYQIRVPGFSNLNFEIIDTPTLKHIIHPRNIGLKINNLAIIESNYDVQGLHYYGDGKLQYESININNWIDVQKNKTKKETSNIILKILTQSQYGK